MSLLIEHPGRLTTIQDLGRFGMQYQGISPSGAMDSYSARIANLLVGNQPTAALLEITLTGLCLRVEVALWIAITGANLAPTIDEIPLPTWRPIRVRSGAKICFNQLRYGCRAYLAVAGGIVVPAILGSTSTDCTHRFGGWMGRALARGDKLPVPPTNHLPELMPSMPFWAPTWSVAWHTYLPLTFPALLHLIVGEDWDNLTHESKIDLLNTTWTVNSVSNRMGLRLDGAKLTLTRVHEKLSGGVATATVQLPPNGFPIVLGVERQTTGGYPVLGTIASIDIPRLAQLRPCETLRFVLLDLLNAQRLLKTRERNLRNLATIIGQQLINLCSHS